MALTAEAGRTQRTTEGLCRLRRRTSVVVADNPQHGEIIVITVYEPDPALWESDFRRRKQ